MAGPVMVGVDSSETALVAARRAAGLARSLGLPLHVVSAYEAGPVEVVEIGSDTFTMGSDSTAHSVAERVASTVRWDGGEVTAAAVEGKPADALVHEAERVGAELLVVGNRRMQGVARVLGSVANSVSHHSPCDVYIVKTT